MIKNSDVGHPFYRPLWRRIVIVAFVAAWFGYEAYSKDGLWTVLSAAMLGYAIWTFFIAWPKDEDGA
ncbi:MAG: DUF3329 domain-containing protein [Rhizobiales bacterium]|nr:DUF3329 domain-containing protein [Hyphomicrobiales bacterium]